jgi:hypothetical protein
MTAPARWSELTISNIREYLQDIRGRVYVGDTEIAISIIDEMLSMISIEEVV